ncbi:MAG: hypothetical protein LBJ10_09175 [Clostridiales bacterium]|jgi:hypothetical protein|nr:hypothetical protein [Clostridiales bacterium]
MASDTVDNGAREKIMEDAIQKKRATDREYVSRLAEEARAAGREEYDVDEALRLYYPNDISGDENSMRITMAALETDYYESSAMTIADWAKRREEIKASGDS